MTRQNSAMVTGVSLAGARIVLRPLRAEHAQAIVDASAEGGLATNRYTPIPRADTIDAYMAYAAASVASGDAIVFVTTLADTGEVVGSSRLWRIDGRHRKLEIGHTWITPPWQRTFVNTEAKYLMLKHAFEVMGYLRVEFQTDELNTQSRTAIARLGATFEGIARKERIMPDGRQRNSARFSIIDDDWPTVRDRLETALRQHGIVPRFVVCN